jgi:hypothetical protein
MQKTQFMAPYTGLCEAFAMGLKVAKAMDRQYSDHDAWLLCYNNTEYFGHSSDILEDLDILCKRMSHMLVKVQSQLKRHIFGDDDILGFAERYTASQGDSRLLAMACRMLREYESIFSK